MLKINKVVLIGFFIFSQMSLLVAQNNTNSPYTRYGYGELADRSFGAGRAMGGVGYGLRSSKQINPMNPASYSCMDSLTFLFDFGASGQVSWFSDGTNKDHNVNGNVEYIAMQFPITRRIAMSIGLLPYSYVGYNFGQLTSQDGKAYIEQFNGTGGLSDLYAGLSVDVWKNRLSVGANFGFLFGNISHKQIVSFNTTASDPTYSVLREQQTRVRDMKMDFGVQYTHPLSAKEKLVVGVVYSPARHLNAKSYDIQSVGSGAGGAELDTITGKAFDTPNSFGLGLSYMKLNQLTLAADFSFEQWSKARFFGEKDDFKNRIRIGAGGEYIPGYNKKSFFSRVRYRAGVHYSNSYLRIKGSSYDEYGASVGLGLPLVDNRSIINISFDYMKVKPDSKALINEQYFRFTVNYTFNEMWFRKFKLD
ncbi:MAG: hypothetical protein RR382_04065 [Tannerellaceae bacterium]